MPPARTWSQPQGQTKIFIFREIVLNEILERILCCGAAGGMSRIFAFGEVDVNPGTSIGDLSGQRDRLKLVSRQIEQDGDGGPCSQADWHSLQQYCLASHVADVVTVRVQRPANTPSLASSQGSMNVRIRKVCHIDGLLCLWL